MQHKIYNYLLSTYQLYFPNQTHTVSTHFPPNSSQTLIPLRCRKNVRISSIADPFQLDSSTTLSNFHFHAAISCPALSLRPPQATSRLESHPHRRRQAHQQQLLHSPHRPHNFLTQRRFDRPEKAHQALDPDLEVEKARFVLH